MWQIVDNSGGRISVALEKEWGSQTARDALKRRHCLGAAMDIAHELTYLGFMAGDDFDLRPASAVSMTVP